MKFSSQLWLGSVPFTKPLSTKLNILIKDPFFVASHKSIQKRWNKLSRMERRADFNSGFEIVFRPIMRHPFSKFRNFSKLLKMRMNSWMVWTKLSGQFLNWYTRIFFKGCFKKRIIKLNRTSGLILIFKGEIFTSEFRKPSSASSFIHTFLSIHWMNVSSRFGCRVSFLELIKHYVPQMILGYFHVSRVLINQIFILLICKIKQILLV